MRALTLWQPWASLIAHGHKRFETRSWSTNYRGPIAIHAAKRPLTREEIVLVLHDDYYRESVKQMGGVPVLPLGAVVAIADLVNVAPTEKVMDSAYFFNMTAKEEALGDYSPGRYAWILQRVVKLERPIPVSGGRGLWVWEAPPEVMALYRPAHSPYGALTKPGV